MRRIVVVYLSSITLAVLGQSIAAIALPLIVLTTTGSVLATGAVAAATALPALITGLFMGVVIDRINRRTASVLADVISAVAIAALPIIDIIAGLNVGWFILFGMLSTFGDGPGVTARETILPAIVRQGNISAERLMGLRETMTTIALLIGPAAAGTLMTVFDGSTVLWITAGTSAAAAVVTLLLPRTVGRVAGHRGQEAPTTGNGWTQLKDGWQVLLKSRFLVGVTLLMLMSLVTLASLQGLILPVYFTTEGSPELLGFVLTALAAGSLLGGLIYTMAGKRGPRRAWFVIGVCGNAVGFAIVSSMAEVWVVFAGAFVLGFFSSLFGALISVLNIERIPEDMRGRILGTQNALIPAAAPGGIAATAVMTEFMSLTATALVFTGLWVVFVIYSLFAASFRNLEKNTDEEPSET